jgi:hypothetical protein
MKPQLYGVGLVPCATVTLSDGRRINRSDYTGDGSNIIATCDPATDDPDIKAWNDGLGSRHCENFDPTRNRDSSLIHEVGFRP